MRIGFVHNLKDGGARRTMAEHMARIDAEPVEVCLGTASAVRDDAIVIPLSLKAPSLPPLARPPARYRDLAAILNAWRVTGHRLAALHLDVVLVHPCQFIQNPPAVTERAILFCHETRRVDHEASAGARRNQLTMVPYAPMYAVERRADARSVAAAAKLLTNSQYTAAGIRRAYGRDAEVIRLGVPSLFTPAPSPLEPRHVLSVGSLIEGKGHALVIESAAISRQGWPVVVVAPQDEPAEQQRLRSIASSAGVQLDVRIGVSDETLLQLYREAVATLYLAEAEPLGLVSLEAQACGCPVIVSAEGGLPETLLPGATGWAVPRVAASAAARLDELQDAALRSTFVSAAAAHGGGYTWDRSTRELERVIGALNPR